MIMHRRSINKHRSRRSILKIRKLTAKKKKQHTPTREPNRIALYIYVQVHTIFSFFNRAYINKNRFRSLYTYIHMESRGKVHSRAALQELLLCFFLSPSAKKKKKKGKEQCEFSVCVIHNRALVSAASIRDYARVGIRQAPRASFFIRICCALIVCARVRLFTVRRTARPRALIARNNSRSNYRTGWMFENLLDWDSIVTSVPRGMYMYLTLRRIWLEKTIWEIWFFTPLQCLDANLLF